MEKIIKKDIIIASIITIIIAALDVLGYPAAWFVDITIEDINPMYFTLIANQWMLIIAGLVAIRYLCPSLKLGLGQSNLKKGILRNWKLGIIISLWFSLSIFIGIVGKFDNEPTFLKVFVESIFYYVSVAILEELYCRGLLLNIIERLTIKYRNYKIIAIVGSSVIFGLGHIPGMIGSVDTYTFIARVIWTTGLGIYLGVAYKRANNLWPSIIIHFLINAFPAILASFKKAYTYPLITTTLIMLGSVFFAAISLYLFIKSENSVEDDKVGFIKID